MPLAIYLRTLKAIILVMAVLLITFISAPESLADNFILMNELKAGSTIKVSQARMKQIVDSANNIAIASVLSPSEQRFFQATANSTIFGFIRPDNVLDPESRRQIHDNTIQILEQDLAAVKSGSKSKLNADIDELFVTLAHTRSKYQKAGYKSAPSEQLASFKEEYSGISENVPGKQLTLEDASRIIGKWGIDPYDMAARPYYCVLGFTGLSTMSVYQVSFCQ